MSARATDSPTLKEILDFNDQVSNNKTPGLSSDATRYTLSTTPLLSVTNWSAIYSKQKLVSCIAITIITILSQLVLTYITLTSVNIRKDLSLVYASQIINLLCSYLLPISLLADFKGVFDDPLFELSGEVEIYRMLRLCVAAESICAIVSVIALYVVCHGSPFIELRHSFQEAKEIAVDMTTFIRVLQLISLQLTLINLALATVSLYLSNIKIRRCFSEVEYTQHVSDYELLLNSGVVTH